jgi:hypothetical protein
MVKVNGVEYNLIQKKLKLIWVNFFQYWIELPSMPAQAKGVLQSMLKFYESDLFDVTKLDAATASYWFIEALRFRYLTQLAHKEGLKGKFSTSDILENLSHYYMWDYLVNKLQGRLSQEQLVFLEKNKEIMRWYQTKLSDKEYQIGMEYFVRLASDPEISSENQKNDEQPEKMKQFVEIFELNFFNNMYIIFDFYFLGLIFLFFMVLTVVIVWFCKFIKKVLKYSKNF